MANDRETIIKTVVNTTILNDRSSDLLRIIISPFTNRKHIKGLKGDIMVSPSKRSLARLPTPFSETDSSIPPFRLIFQVSFSNALFFFLYSTTMVLAHLHP